MSLDLVDTEEEQRDPGRGDRMHDQCVDERRNRSEPGAEVRDQLGDGNPGPEEQRVLLAARQPAEHAEEPEADAGARADDQRDQRLSADVAHQRVLHPNHEVLAARPRRKAAVESVLQPREVEQHVDRDDEDDDRAEQELPDRDRSSLGKADDLVRVLADVVFADVAHEPVAAGLDVDRPEPVRVQPGLEVVHVTIGRDLPRSSVHVRKVGVHTRGSRFRLIDDDGADSADGRDHRQREDQVHESDREAARNAQRRDRPDDR